MNRLVVIAILVATASIARARRVVHIPALRELCPSGASWDAVAKCIARHGRPRILRELQGAKLVWMPDGTELEGLYLFVQGEQDSWRMIDDLRGRLDLLAFEPFLGGYRIDVGIVGEVEIDDRPHATALLKQKLTSVCPKKSQRCVQFLTGCDVLVHGKAYWSYRGTPTIEGDKLKIVGDRSVAGMFCDASGNAEIPL